MTTGLTLRQGGTGGVTSRKTGLTRQSGGFTVIEVLVATVIISIVLAPLATAYMLHHRASVRAGAETTALMLAQDRLEELKARPYAEVAGTAFRWFTEVPGYEQYAGYGYEVEVSTGALRVKTITVTVTYPTLDGTGTLALQTERARR